MSISIIDLEVQEKEGARWLSIQLLLPSWKLDKDKLRDVALTALAVAVAGLVLLLLVQLAPQWVGPFLDLFK
jgi:hypothetical protein